MAAPPARCQRRPCLRPRPRWSTRGPGSRPHFLRLRRRSPGGSVHGGEGRGPKPGEVTGHSTRHTRTHTAHTCTRDDFWRTPLHSGPRHTAQAQRRRHRCRAPASGAAETPRRGPGRDSGVYAFFRPEKQTRRNNKKISLHRFKPIIFSKMIQNCQNRVEGVATADAPGSVERPRRGGPAALDRASVPASVSPSASLPGPGQRVRVGRRAAPAVAARGSVRFSLVCSPRALRSGWPGERPES